jgi:hypothetical protein
LLSPEPAIQPEEHNVMNPRSPISILVATWGVLSACGSAPPRTEATAGPGPHAGGGMGMHGTGGMGMMGDEMCPMRVEGTTVAVSDVEGGVALAFTTSTGDVAQVRERARRMAAMHDGRPGMGMGMMPAATATVEDIDGGARITLVANDPAQEDALRQHVRMHAERMQGGECPMMQQPAEPPAPPPPA